MSYLDSVVGEIEEPEANNVHDGSGPARAGVRAAAKTHKHILC